MKLREYLNQHAKSLSAYEIVGLWLFTALVFLRSDGYSMVSLDDSLVEETRLWNCTARDYEEALPFTVFEQFIQECIKTLESTNESPCIPLLKKIAVDVFDGHFKNLDDIELVVSILSRQFLIFRQQRNLLSIYQPIEKPNDYSFYSNILSAIDSGDELAKQKLAQEIILPDPTLYYINQPLERLLRGETTHRSKDGKYVYQPHSAQEEESDLEEDDDGKRTYYKREYPSATSFGNFAIAGKVGIFYTSTSTKPSSRFLKVVRTRPEEAKLEAELFEHYLGLGKSTVSVIELAPSFFALVQPHIKGSPITEHLKSWSARDFLNPDHWKKLAAYLTQAVMRLQEKKMIHSDLNPYNILIDEATGRITFIDFGLASYKGVKVPKFYADQKPATAERPAWTYRSPDSSEKDYTPSFEDDVYFIYVFFGLSLSWLSCHALPLIYLFQQQSGGFPPKFEDCTLETFNTRFTQAITILNTEPYNTLSSLADNPNRAYELLSLYSTDTNFKTILVAYVLAIYINQHDIENAVNFLQRTNVLHSIEFKKVSNFYNQIPNSTYIIGLQQIYLAASSSEQKLEFLDKLNPRWLKYLLESYKQNLDLPYKRNQELLYFFLELAPHLLLNPDYLDILIKWMGKSNFDASSALMDNGKQLTPIALNKIASFFYLHCIQLSQEAKKSRLFITLFSIPQLTSWLRLQCINSKRRIEISRLLPQGLTQHLALLKFIDKKITYYQGEQDDTAHIKSLCLNFTFQCILTHAIAQPTSDLSSLIDLTCMILGYKRFGFSFGIAAGLAQFYDEKSPEFLALSSNSRYRELQQGKTKVLSSLFQSYPELAETMQSYHASGKDLYDIWQQRQAAAQAKPLPTP